jgi:molecular chaperone GrpE
MTDSNGQDNGHEAAAQDNEVQAAKPQVSKPYIMPDDPEEGSAEALAKELGEARDKVLRTLAEMENLRRRTTREIADARIYGITSFARDILDIADNLQRALDAVPAEAKAAADPGLKALIEGVELTERSLLNTLEKNGVKKFDPTGERFDPNFQQAMYEVPDPSVPAGTVMQVAQAGYKIGDRILRPVAGRRQGGGRRTGLAEFRHRRLKADAGYRRSMPSRTARNRVNICGHSSRVDTPMICNVAPPPNRSHCTTVIGLPSLRLVALKRVS